MAKNGFILTDPDRCQLRREIAPHEYELWEARVIPGPAPQIYACHDVIDFAQEDEASLSDVLGLYYELPDDAAVLGMDDLLGLLGLDEGILAECLFETEDLEDIESHGPWRTAGDAEAYIKDSAGLVMSLEEDGRPR